MCGKTKNSAAPSDAQAREKLALYVYEYLLHVGAQKAAQTFLSEIRWEKNITLGEAPGFLHSWWCVFWDLYCAAPERREQCEHSSEAKAFHDYGFVNSGYGGPGGPPGGPGAPSPHGQIMPPNEGMPGGSMPPNFFPSAAMRPSPPNHPNSQQSTHPHPQAPPSHGQMMPGQPFMGGAPRYGSGPRPGLRMPPGLGNEFNGPPSQPMMPNSMDPRHGGPPFGMNPRMNPPRGPVMGPGPYGPGMRGPPPNNNMGPGGPGMPPMGMAGGRPQWNPNSAAPMNYSAPSPGNYGGPSSSGPGPGTPIMPSPQHSNNSENMYTMMKSVPGSNMGPDFPMGGGPENNGPMALGPNAMGSDGLDGMKNSPGPTPGTPREDSRSGMGEYSLGGFGGPGENDQIESAAILKIKESMQEEAKRFETDSDHPDYFMQ